MSSSQFFDRMFAPAQKPIATADEAALIALGDSMRDLSQTEAPGIFTPHIGYTYFGQFIDHDLTNDRTPLDGPYAAPTATRNYRTAFLDLDNVYGGGPSACPALY